LDFKKWGVPLVDSLGLLDIEEELRGILGGSILKTNFINLLSFNLDCETFDGLGRVFGHTRAYLRFNPDKNIKNTEIIQNK